MPDGGFSGWLGPAQPLQQGPERTLPSALPQRGWVWLRSETAGQWQNPFNCATGGTWQGWGMKHSPPAPGQGLYLASCLFPLLQQASRAQILDKATEYIQYMRRKNHTHQQDIDDLKRQNALLEQQGEPGRGGWGEPGEPGGSWRCQESPKGAGEGWFQGKQGGSQRSQGGVTGDSQRCQESPRGSREWCRGSSEGPRGAGEGGDPRPAATGVTRWPSPRSARAGEGPLERPASGQLPLDGEQPLHQPQRQRHLRLRRRLRLQLRVGARRAAEQEEAAHGGQLGPPRPPPAVLGHPP